MLKRLFTTVILLLILFPLKSANYYWIGGDGTPGGTYANPKNGSWSILSNWRDSTIGGNIPSSVPSTKDDVYINIPSAAVTINIPSSEIFSKNFTFNGNGKVSFDLPSNTTINCNGSFTWNGSGELIMGANSNINIKESITIGAAANINVSPLNSFINLIGDGGNYNINTNNALLNVYNFNINSLKPSTNYTFTSPLNTSRLVINAGVIDFGNFNYSLSFFLCDNTSPRVLNLNSSKFDISNSFRVGGNGLVVNSGSSEIILNNNSSFIFNSTSPLKFNKVTTKNNIPTATAATINSLTTPGLLEFQVVNIFHPLKVIARGISIDTVIFNGNTSLSLPSKDIVPSNNFNKINKAIISSSGCSLPLLENLGVGVVDLRLGGNLTTTALATKNIHVTTGSLTVNTWSDIADNLNISGTSSSTPNNFYWTNSSGNMKWSDKNNWRLGSCSGTIPSCPPSFNDNVIIDGCGPGIDRINMDVEGSVNNITWTTNVANGQTILIGSEDLNVYGNFDIQKNGLIITHTKNINFNGKNNSISSGTTNISSNIIINSSGIFNINNDLKTKGNFVHKFGTLITNNFNINCLSFTSGDPDNFYFVSQSCKPARTLDLGSSTITMSAGGNSNPLLIYAGNLTLPANTSTFLLTGSGNSNDILTASIYSTCQTKNLAWNNIFFTGNGDFTQYLDVNQTIATRNTFKNIRFSSNGKTSSYLSYDTLFIRSGKTYTFNSAAAAVQHIINSTIEIEGSTACDALTFIQGTTFPINLRKTSGTLQFNNVILRNVTGTGGATFNAIQSVNAGNVTNFNFSSSIPNSDYYWNNSAGGDWNDCNNWSIGSPSGPNPTVLPSPVSNVHFSIPINGTIKVSSTSFCKNMTWTLPSGNAIFSGDKPIYVFGSMNLESSARLNWQYNGYLYFISDVPNNDIQLNGQILNNNIYFVGNGEYNLKSPLILGKGATASDYFNVYIESGTFNTSNFNIQAGSFISTTDYIRNINLGSSTITTLLNGVTINGTNLNLNSGTSTFVCNSTFTIQNKGLNFYNILFNGSGAKDMLNYSSTNPAAPLPFYNNVTFLNNGSISGNHVYDSLEFSTGKTYKIASNSVQKIIKTLIASGTPCEFTTIQGTISGQTAGFFKTTGNDIHLYQVYLVDIAGLKTNPNDGSSSTASYFASGNSTSNGNTPGWTIGESPDFQFGFGGGRIDSLKCTDFPYTISTSTFYKPKSYLWSDGSTASTFVANQPGKYSLTAFYENNCKYTDSIYLFLDDKVDFIFNSKNPTCYNSTNGVIEVIPNDSQTHTYIWKNLADTTAKISNLVSGTYSVTVNKGICTKDDSIKIFKDTIKVTLSPTDPGCLNNDGQIQSNSIYTQGNVIYSWTPASAGNTALITGLSGGDYILQITDDSLCTAIDSTHLTFIPLPTVSFNPIPDFCENNNTPINLSNFASPAGGRFFGNGITSTSFTPSIAGEGTHLLSYEISDTNNCKDTASVNVLINDTSIVQISATICALDSFQVGNQFYNKDGTYSNILSKSNGCDSLVILQLLTIPLPDTTIANPTDCEGNTITLPDGSSFVSDTSHSITFKNFVNCDSTVKYILSFIPKIRMTVQREICDGDIFSFGSANLTVSGTYIDTFPSSVNCDSIVTLQLIVHPLSPITSIAVQGCEGKTVTLPDGFAMTLDGFHDIILPDIHSCDSTIRYNVQFVKTIQVAISDTICDNQTYILGSQTLQSSGIYTETFLSSAGCDSIVTLTLTVYPTYPLKTYLFEPCEGDSLTLPDGAIVYSNVKQTFNLQAFYGCDSIVQYDIRFKPILKETISPIICANEYFNLNGQMLNLSGTYKDTILSSINCDSIITVQLTVVPLPDTTILDILRCNGDSFTYPDNSTTSISQSKDFKYLTANNCDSIVRYKVLFLDKILNTVFDTICANQTYSFGGNNFNTTGTYIDTFQASIGCDSIVTLQLQVNPLPPIFAINLTPCEGDTVVLPDNSSFIKDAIKDIILPNFQGCDSTVRYTIKYIPTIRTQKDTAICEGQTFAFGSQNITSAGTYTEIFNAATGCDSIVTLNLSIISIQIGIDQSEICEYQTAKLSIKNSSPTQIAWFRDANDLNKATPTINVQTAGNYYAVAGQGTGCRDTSNTITLNIKPTPIINLGTDQLICQGDSILFDGSYPNANSSYIWNNGLQTASIYAKDSGIYAVTVNLNGCLYTDSIQLTVQALPIVDLGADFSACIDSIAILSNNNEPGKYKWNDGSTSTSLNVTTNGIYTLEVTQGKCKNSDSIQVTFELVPPIIDLGIDTSFCVNKFVTIGSEVSNALNYEWNTGASTSYIDAKEAGVYTLKVSNQCGFSIDSIQITQENCECGVFVPKAFSPNNSSNNNLKPIVTCLLSDYYFAVYNRWGEKLFESTTIGESWDGTKNGKEQPLDGYTFYVKYRLDQEEQYQELTGVAVLIR
ncbi:MAG: gliding motility-associated C-terminal domain-containing protein [Chitinophagales bacterium]|nr:gliding motility-associated C-terminal domain-containing protein [Chitinophagales bacterium]